jgi:hypothetical protein
LHASSHFCLYPWTQVSHAAPLDIIRRRAGNLLTLPQSQDELIQHYTLNDTDLALVKQRRGESNRLGFAVQLCLCCVIPAMRWVLT